ncbi:hypothetical protein PA01_19125 [Azoarcus sp. PA01]|nr:hypothetical protein PA01_19125 [Azoarcus sp. PA01]
MAFLLRAHQGKGPASLKSSMQRQREIGLNSCDVEMVGDETG